MSTGTDADFQTLQAEIAKLRTDFAEVTKTLQQIVANRSTAVLGDAKDGAEKLAAELQRHARNVATEVEERPMAAALTTFSIGLILGFLFAGRRS